MTLSADEIDFLRTVDAGKPLGPCDDKQEVFRQKMRRRGFIFHSRASKAWLITPSGKEALRYAERAVADAKPDSRLVRIDYTNWKGERQQRTIHPLNMFWGSNEWHPQPQWLIEAFDLEKKAVRTFAANKVHGWVDIQ